ncbi:carbon-phosphorus lyase complex subunit PhnI [Acidithiobacillus thiooxidans]|uniref:Alpha-D-ribose 1-methylphosphonate 5-triphosphate synthase subunit PhnI n=1 Tax=Acidithiobacillus thiooxidans ATCC 19377 TaxID=637390 RepID=A0A543Q864_ACITH|nr:carbon-phosphorus lyase complex subunit PhnI [Acidithiobacillus thiooxidans]MDX5935994.1 carbon-phosphorus lyase complex subunit PhnI [Acidithiobacillus thiooxidans]TQN52503.1 Alpha-D-ribose 1-methylphosphonate 5-triphosphate synthase subunit PhnI [Acidithiobacillus thiooxidans ATCC 19377]
MSYVAAKGGAQAIHAAHQLVAERNAPNPDDLQAQIARHLHLGIDRIMAEASLYDRDIAAKALLQAQGDSIEAVFIVRAYRATLSRFLDSLPLNLGQAHLQRHISAAFKDVPGGQQLGATYDYSHRLLGYFQNLPAQDEAEASCATSGIPPKATLNKTSVMELLETEGLIEKSSTEPADAENRDITQIPPGFPASRAQRLQTLARADEGFVLGMAYSTQRGYGQNHPFIAELSHGSVKVEICPPELGFSLCIGTIEMTECQMINQFQGDSPETATFTRGYGLVFGHNERKAIAMALLDRALRAQELGEKVEAPAQDEEFVLSHCDNVEATGFVEHLKLPHHVDFQSEISTLRALRAQSPGTTAQHDDAL